MDSLTWRWCDFESLSVQELQAINAARQTVFSIEQQCIYLDADGCDEQSFHLAAWARGHRLPLAYARIVHPGLKYPEPSIGRVLTMEPVRGTGIGREVVRRAIAHCREAFPGQGICISAQTRLERFYLEAGFRIAGEPYLDYGIPHTDMLLD